jgi:uncharacterized protein YndB with AHSA1/START domain
MKRVFKVLGSIILILGAIFLAAGVIIPELEYETDIVIDRPLDTTFVLFNDESRLQEWLTTIKDIEHVSGAPKKPGFVRKYYTEDRGRRFEIEETLIEFVPNEKVVIQFVAGGMSKDNTVLFASDGDKTKITHLALARGSSHIDRCMFAFFKAAFKKIDQENLNSFKRFAEDN